MNRVSGPPARSFAWLFACVCEMLLTATQQRSNWNISTVESWAAALLRAHCEQQPAQSSGTMCAAPWAKRAENRLQRARYAQSFTRVVLFHRPEGSETVSELCVLQNSCRVWTELTHTNYMSETWNVFMSRPVNRLHTFLGNLHIWELKAAVKPQRFLDT